MVSLGLWGIGRRVYNLVGCAVDVFKADDVARMCTNAFRHLELSSNAVVWCDVAQCGAVQGAHAPGTPAKLRLAFSCACRPKTRITRITFFPNRSTSDLACNAHISYNRPTILAITIILSHSNQ